MDPDWSEERREDLIAIASHTLPITFSGEREIKTDIGGKESWRETEGVRGGRERETESEREREREL